MEKETKRRGGTAVNIGRMHNLKANNPKNTAPAKINIHSDQDVIKEFEFGYSDREVAFLNGEPIPR